MQYSLTWVSAFDKTLAEHVGECNLWSAHFPLPSLVQFCVECQERYCECCYSEFHRRGALARHHAQPLGSDQHRSLMEVNVPHSIPIHPVGEGQGGEGGHAPFDTGGNGSLLEGTFNEDESTASFQEALMAWRTGGSGGDKQGEGEEELTKDKGDKLLFNWHLVEQCVCVSVCAHGIA